MSEKYQPKKFDVDVVVNVSPTGMKRLPSPKDLSAMYNLFGNNEYEDFSRPDLSDVKYIIEAEQEWFAQIRGGNDWEAEYEDVCGWIESCFDFPAMDFGVAGAAYALNASGCITGLAATAAPLTQAIMRITL